MIILLVAGFALIVALEVPGLVRKGYWRELAVFGVLLGAAFVLSIMMAMGVKLPYVSSGITKLVKSVFHLKVIQ